MGALFAAFLGAQLKKKISDFIKYGKLLAHNWCTNWLIDIVDDIGEMDQRNVVLF